MIFELAIFAFMLRLAFGGRRREEPPSQPQVKIVMRRPRRHKKSHITANNRSCSKY